MSETHDCPCGCGAPVPRHRFACRQGWYALPARLRSRISGSYLIDPDEHAKAMAEALRWYADNATPRGTRKVEFGQTMEWTGSTWRHVTRAELDREAYRRSRS